MRKSIVLILLFNYALVNGQDSLNYKQFSAGINLLSGVFKTAEINTEFMFNPRLGITMDLGYQFSTNAGSNLNLRNNLIEGYYGKIGPRLYFAPHTSRGNGYLSSGFIYSKFKQSGTIKESDYYEPSRITIGTKQKLEGTYLGIGTLIKMQNSFTLDFGTVFNFFSPQSINFAQDFNNVTNAQPGFGNFVSRSSGNFGMGLGINCSIKYEFIHR